MSKDIKINREAERESALILHDVRVSPTLCHPRGAVVQLRGDVFDRESAAGNCIAYDKADVNLTLLPDPLPSDTVHSRVERMRRELLLASGAEVKASGLRADEAAADLAHREALQAAHTAHASEAGIKVAKRGMAQPKK